MSVNGRPPRSSSAKNRGTNRPSARSLTASAKVRAQHVSVQTRRPLLLLIVMVVCAGTLMARLAFWSLIEHGRLAAAAAQRTSISAPTPLRGLIFDAQGDPLALDVTMDVVYANPREIKEPQKTAVLLAPLLNQSVKSLTDLLSSHTTYVPIASRVGHDIANKITNLALPGIAFYPVVRRDYPEQNVASHALGFVNSDNQGNYGLEQYYQDLLAGNASLTNVLKGAAANDVRVSSGPNSPIQDGANLHLSIDRVVQQFAQTDLQKAVKTQRADGGTVIVTDPRTGYILAMAGSPSFNPNQYSAAANKNVSVFLNPDTQWTYEPGSTFKIITMAAGLDTHVITPQSAFYDSGRFVVGDRTIHNWNLQGYGVENMIQVLQHSANVGASWVASRLGQDRFYKYVRAFRFGLPTGVDLAGEYGGLLPLPGDKSWTPVSLYTSSFGQGIAVTPLQLIQAVSAVANGGVLMKPQMVKQVGYEGHIIYHPPVSEGRVISARTARTLTNMLVQSAIGGEASRALISGYNIAAKTGTANIAGPQGGYIQGLGSTVASTVAYAPAYHPRFVALVVLNRPRNTPWGSIAAAPVIHNLFQDLFMYYHVPPSQRALYR